MCLRNVGCKAGVDWYEIQAIDSCTSHTYKSIDLENSHKNHSHNTQASRSRHQSLAWLKRTQCKFDFGNVFEDEPHIRQCRFD